jgi:hypothetical protein
MSRWNDWTLLLSAFAVGLIVFSSPPPSHATVYAWKSENGALHLSNELENIPEAQRTTAQQFTAKPAEKIVREGTVPPAPPSPEVTPTTAYERGLERGLQMAERQVALAGELARSVLAAVPPRPPTRIIIQQPPQTIIRYVTPGYYSPFYGPIGPYAPYVPCGGFGYAYGFGYGRFVPHSHFFPGIRGRRSGLFFPHGHFSQDGFLFGHGFVVR